MNLLSALERLAAIDFAPIALDAKRCLHAFDTFSTCDQCARACPADALHVDGSIVLDADQCTGCGQCVHVCPMGALSGDDEAADLLSVAAQLKPAQVIELACQRHPSPERGPATSDAVIRTNGCLAALGPSAIIGLLAAGCMQVIARLDACDQCPIGSAQPRIEQTLANTRRMLAPHATDRITSLGAQRGKDWTRRPQYAKKAGTSRRDFLQRIAGEGQQAAARALALDRSDRADDAAEQKSAPTERLRLLDALGQLPRSVLCDTTLDGLPFAYITADERCSACGVCVRVCPSGALNFVADDNRYDLTFFAGACTDCGACLHVCQPDALRRESVTLDALIQSAPVVLQQGSLRRCAKCGARFAGESDMKLCPVCDFRRKNPFDRRLPPAFQRHRASSSR